MNGWRDERGDSVECGEYGMGKKKDWETNSFSFFITYHANDTLASWCLLVHKLVEMKKNEEFLISR